MSADEVVKVSIIMPIYNRAKVLPKAVRSVLNQTLHEIELLCINDGSTDDSIKVLKRIAREDSRVRILSQRNKGAGPARNYGLKRARGEFVAFLDSDDWYASNCALEKLYYKAIENHVKICIGGSRRARLGKLLPLDKPGKEYFTKEQLMSFQDYQCTYGYCRGIYDRKMVLQNEIFFPPYRRFQDPPFFMEAMICARYFYVITDMVLVYDESCNYHKINWNEEAITDLLRGIRDIIRMAQAESYIELQRYFIERIKTGEKWNGILVHNLCSDWLEAKGVMEETNTYFMEDAMRRWGLPKGERPFDEILKKVYGHNYQRVKRECVLRAEKRIQSVRSFCSNLFGALSLKSR